MTLHEICAVARYTGCVCGAAPGRPCTCGPGGVHYARIARARRAGYLSAEDFAQAIHDADVFTGRTLLLDPEVPQPCSHCGGTGTCGLLACSLCRHSPAPCAACGGTGTAGGSGT